MLVGNCELVKGLNHALSYRGHCMLRIFVQLNVYKNEIVILGNVLLRIV